MRMFKSCLKAMLAFSLLVFVTTSELAAKKPVKPPPVPSDDPCISMETFSPDFVFWRDATKKRIPKVTIFLADSNTGCEQKLVDISLIDTGPINDLKLNFSSYVDEGGMFGRVVWARQITGHAISVWKYDFRIQQGSVIPDVSDPTMILENTDEENQDINDLALSPNAETLAYLFIERFEDWTEYSIRTIDINLCGDVCTFESGTVVGLITDYPITVNYFRSPVWGPLGRRIYFVQLESASTREAGSSSVHFHDLGTEGWKLLFTVRNAPGTLGQPGYRGIRKIASGIPKGCTEPYDCEYLAVQISWNVFSRCANLHLATVNECNDIDDACLSGPVIAGINPSWTKDGKLIHTYQGWTLRDNEKNCKIDTVGLWDGNYLDSLTKGYEPNVAGGLP